MTIRNQGHSVIASRLRHSLHGQGPTMGEIQNARVKPMTYSFSSEGCKFLGEIPNPVYQLQGKFYEVDEAGIQGEPGEVYEIEWQTDGSAQALNGVFSKLWKSVTSPVRKLVRKVNLQRKKLLRSVTKSKWGRQIIRVAGVVAAPFTGGLSLAAAEALARYGKARYGQGQSRSSAFKRGAVGAAVGYVGGRAISAGYSAVANRAASSAVSSAASGAAATTTATTTTAATTTTGFFSKALAVAKAAGSFAVKALPLATTLMQAGGGGGGGGGAVEDAMVGAADYFGMGEPMHDFIGAGADYWGGGGDDGSAVYGGIAPDGGGQFSADTMPDELPLDFQGAVPAGLTGGAKPLLLLGGVVAGAFIFTKMMR